MKTIGESKEERMNINIPELTEELWKIYEAEHGEHGLSSFKNADIPLTTISELPAIACHQLNLNDAIDFFLSRYQVSSSAHPLVSHTVRNILNFEHSTSNPLSRDFLTKCAKLYLGMWADMYQGQHERPSLPRCPSQDSALVDLASGPEFVNFFADLDPSTMYWAVDSSFFAIECMRLKAEAVGLNNIVALQKDVATLARKDISVPSIQVIRAKNIFTYVPTYLNSFQNHLNWLADDGRFIFAEQASRKEDNSTFIHPLVKQRLNHLVSNGWGFTYSFGNISNPLDLNNITLLKAREGTMESNLRELENFYIELNTIYGSE